MHAATNDVYPGDYYPADPGTMTLSFYAYDRAATGPYVDGDKVADGKVLAQIAAVRLVNTFGLDALTTSSIVVLSWADLKSSPEFLSGAIGNNSQGFGDLRLGLTTWLINDRPNAHYLGLTAMLIAPTGDYDGSQLLNHAENRWRLVLSGGWQKDITPRFLIELSPELTVYGDNNDYAGGNRLEQDPALALTGYLRWRLTRPFHLHLGGQRNWGGEAKLSGVARDNPAENTRVNLGATWFMPDKQQLILRLSRETRLSNGFRTDYEVALRYQKGF